MCEKMPDCAMCSKSFKQRRQLNLHIVTHTKEKPHRCLTCSAIFGRLGCLRKHIKEVHEGVKTKTKVAEKKFQCPTCNLKCNRPSHLVIHMRQHSGETPYSCKVPGCGFKTKYKGSSLQHFKNVHTQDRPHLCTVKGCNYKAKVKGDLNRHQKIHSNEKPFVCKFPGCKYRVNFKSGLELHIFRAHSEEKPLKCSTCDFRTKYKIRLRQHEDEHKNIKRFSCSKCSFATNCKQYMQLHVESKHMKKTVDCPEPGCNYRCGGTALLQKHVRVLHELKILRCPSHSCTFSTRLRANLRKHVSRKHKKLQSASLLVAVQQSDTFICPIPKCGYQTEFQHRLNCHVRTHENKTSRDLACEFCPSTFKKPAELQDHVRRHIGEKPYSCSYCEYTAVNSTGLRLHAGKHHEIYVDSRGEENKYTRNCRICNVIASSCTQIVLHSMTHLKAVVVLERLSLNVL